MAQPSTLVDSQDSFWETSELDDAVTETVTRTDETQLINPPDRVCPGCGEEIVRFPGQKGRLPKYHPECKPVRSSRSSDGPRPVRVTSKDRQIAEQVELALETIQGYIAKGVMLLSLVDTYDAFVVHVNSRDMIKNLRPLMMRFPWMREQATNAAVGGSILGLILTVITTLLPIGAHHGLIPSKKVAQILLNIPVIMARLQERMDAAESHETMSDALLERLREEEQRKRAQMREATDPVDASTHAR